MTEARRKVPKKKKRDAHEVATGLQKTHYKPKDKRSVMEMYRHAKQQKAKREQEEKHSQSAPSNSPTNDSKS